MRLSWARRERELQPDASLAIMDNHSPFLVLECAHSQKAKGVRMKAQDYIHGADPRIQYVVIIFIDTMASTIGDTETAEPTVMILDCL